MWWQGSAWREGLWVTYLSSLGTKYARQWLLCHLLIQKLPFFLFWLYLELFTQELFMAPYSKITPGRIGGPLGMPTNKLWMMACKTSALMLYKSLGPKYAFFYTIFITISQTRFLPWFFMRYFESNFYRHVRKDNVSGNILKIF